MNIQRRNAPSKAGLLSLRLLCSVTERMAVAAEIAGRQEEAAFWKALPQTLTTLRASLPQSFSQPAPSMVLYRDLESGISAYRRSSEDRSRYS